MTSFQKFKFLATQCTATASPTLSPTTSPVVHLRRRKTLRRLLTGRRRRLPENDESIDRRRNSPEKRKEFIGVRSKLRDLFVSSPPSGETTECRGVLPATDSESSVSDWRRFGPRSIRPLSSLRLRQRLMRRSVWHPALGTIPE